MNDKTIVIFPTDIKTIDISNYDKLQSNWNSLREYIEKRIQDCKRYYPCCSEEFQHLLDKMNELEGEDKK